MTTNTTRKNRFPGDCLNCKVRIPAEAGILERLNGQWIVRHETCPHVEGLAKARAALKGEHLPFDCSDCPPFGVVVMAHEGWDGEPECELGALRHWLKGGDCGKYRGEPWLDEMWGYCKKQTPAEVHERLARLEGWVEEMHRRWG